MSIPRRTFLRGGLPTAHGALVVERTAHASTVHHPVNRALLRPSSYLRPVATTGAERTVELVPTSDARVARVSDTGTADHLRRLS
jgi:hypothetical protein